jgi:hypothetical protein
LLPRWLESGGPAALYAQNPAIFSCITVGEAAQWPGEYPGLLSDFRPRYSVCSWRRTRPASPRCTRFPLLLATPTVDIGYNFDKPGKLCQPLDFIVFDAGTRDACLQRLGRAGRVLGRSQTNIPSDAVALVAEKTYLALAALDGRMLPAPSSLKLSEKLCDRASTKASYSSHTTVT